MCQPNIEAVNNHLAENDLRSIDEFCAAANDVFDDSAWRESINHFRAEPLASHRLDKVHSLLSDRTHRSEVAKQLVAWCKIFPAIVEEVKADAT